jgi:hypothetical protein
LISRTTNHKLFLNEVIGKLIFPLKLPPHQK